MKISLGCTCGSSWYGRMPAEACAAVTQIWNDHHRGDGHAPCSVREAGLIRRGIEARELREAEKQHSG
jgi:hypothetical protein